MRFVCLPPGEFHRDPKKRVVVRISGEHQSELLLQQFWSKEKLLAKWYVMAK
jgi:hypothetical protein